MRKLFGAIPALAAMVIVGLAATALSQDAKTGTAAPPGQSLTDEQFAKKAALGGMVEVKLGKMAQERAASADVKKHGHQMVEDHTKVNDDLMRLAKKKGMVLPTDLDKEHQEKTEKFLKLQGPAFDQAYVMGQIEDHQKAIELYENQARKGQDAELKSFADRTLPTLKKHLAMAKDLAKRTGQDR